MRTIAAILLLVAAPALFGASTYEVRSALHLVTVDVDGEGDTREYAVRVVDHQTGALLVTERLTPTRRQAKVDTDSNLSIHVHVGEMSGTLTISMMARNNGAVVDSINANFMIKALPGIITPVPPPPAPLLPPVMNPQGAYRVGGDVKAPVVVHRVEPLYPEEARKARVAGIVIVESIIDEEGNVVDARVLKPLPFGLDQSALDAVKQWKFRAGTLDGKPVKTIFNLTLNFKLGEDVQP